MLTSKHTVFMTNTNPYWTRRDEIGGWALAIGIGIGLLGAMGGIVAMFLPFLR